MVNLMPTLSLYKVVWVRQVNDFAKRSALAALSIFFCLSAAGIVTCYSSNVASASGMADVAGNWAAAQIGQAVSAGYVKGYPDGLFKPDAGVTRAEFVTMIDSAFKVEPSQAGPDFKDVHSKDWFAPDVDSSLAAGFVSGYPDGTFRPQTAVTRQEAACILDKLLKPNGKGSLSVTDAAQIDSWAKPSVAQLVASGIISGYPDGSFRPKNIISRGEAAALINKALASKGLIKLSNQATATPAAGSATGSVTESAAPVVSRDAVPDVVSVAMRFLGTPYRYGANGPKSFDCSGFARYVYALEGVQLPRVASEQARAGTRVSSPAPGDLVFFSNSSKGYITHVGIYIGNNNFIHASVTGVEIDSLNSSWYRSRYVMACRVL